MKWLLPEKPQKMDSQVGTGFVSFKIFEVFITFLGKNFLKCEVHEER
jgi:hypothetical protein